MLVKSPCHQKKSDECYSLTAVIWLETFTEFQESSERIIEIIPERTLFHEKLFMIVSTKGSHISYTSFSALLYWQFWVS